MGRGKKQVDGDWVTVLWDEVCVRWPGEKEGSGEFNGHGLSCRPSHQNIRCCSLSLHLAALGQQEKMRTSWIYLMFKSRRVHLLITSAR